MRKLSSTNAVLLSIVAVLALLLLTRAESSSALPAADGAQPEPSGSQPLTSVPFNATEQRRQMISQLEQISRRLAALEAKLQSGITVNVKEMPAVKIADDGRQK